MDLMLLIAGLAQLIISLAVGIVFVFAAFNFFKSLTKNIDEMKELTNNNISVALLSGSIVFSIVYIVHASMGPAIDALKQTLVDTSANIWSYLKTSALMLSHIVIAGLLSFFSVYLAFRIFIRLTRGLDELAEVKKNNVAVGILLAVIIVSIALFIQPAVKTILEALIPLPPLSPADMG